MSAEQPMPLQAVVIPVTPLQQNCSLFWCTKTMKGAFVDPGGEMDKLLAAAKDENVTIERILVTHGHSDHAGNVAAIARDLGVPVEGPHEDDLFWIERIPDSGKRYGIDRAESFAPFGAGAPGVVLIGSVGKTVWGGVRIGWIRADRGVIHKLVRARSAGDLGTPVLEQLLVKNLLDDFDAILQTRREQLRAGRDHLVGALRQAFPEWAVPDVAGGLTVWANIGHPVSSQLTLAARGEGPMSLVLRGGSSGQLDVRLAHGAAMSIAV